MNERQAEPYKNHELIKGALTLVVDNFGLWIKTVLIMMIPVVIRLSGLMLIVGGAGFFSLNMISDNPFFSYLDPLLAKLSLKMFIIAFCAYIFFECAWSILQLGAGRIALDLHDNQVSKISRLFSCFRLMMYNLIAAYLYFVIVGIGLVFFIVPGLILFARLWFFRLLMIERQCGPIEALKGSFLMTKGHVLSLLETCFLLITFALIPCATCSFNSCSTYTFRIFWTMMPLVFIMYPFAEMVGVFMYKRLLVNISPIRRVDDNQLTNVTK